MARVRVADVRLAENLTAEKEGLILRAGRRAFRPMLHSLENRELMDAGIGRTLMHQLPNLGHAAQIRLLAQETSAEQSSLSASQNVQDTQSEGTTLMNNVVDVFKRYVIDNGINRWSIDQYTEPPKVETDGAGYLVRLYVGYDNRIHPALAEVDIQLMPNGWIGGARTYGVTNVWFNPRQNQELPFRDAMGPVVREQFLNHRNDLKGNIVQDTQSEGGVLLTNVARAFNTYVIDNGINRWSIDRFTDPPKVEADGPGYLVRLYVGYGNRIYPALAEVDIQLMPAGWTGGARKFEVTNVWFNPRQNQELPFRDAMGPVVRDLLNVVHPNQLLGKLVYDGASIAKQVPGIISVGLEKYQDMQGLTTVRWHINNFRNISYDWQTWGMQMKFDFDQSQEIKGKTTFWGQGTMTLSLTQISENADKFIYKVLDSAVDYASPNNFNLPMKQYWDFLRKRGFQFDVWAQKLG